MNSFVNYGGRKEIFAATFAIRARQIVFPGPPARGKELFAPARILDNFCLVINHGLIEDITRTPACPVKDLGDVAILPPVANCHTHLQFSWLAGKTTWRKGFTQWLKSLIPFVVESAATDYADAAKLTALAKACAALAGSMAGDIGGSLPHTLTAVHQAAKANDVDITHFCECFGFGQEPPPWPARCFSEIGRGVAASCCAPAGHALYSTSPQTLKMAKDFCKTNGKVFTFHLAESPEETQLLAEGAGPLHALYRGVVLPEDWQPPRRKPMAFALANDLIDKGTLAVHGTQLERAEIEEFARTGAALCLCPRSNDNLGVGLPQTREILESGILCCLGTDGLTSNTDLDVRNEAFFLERNQDIPIRALWRMATVNGAAALGKECSTFAKNCPARFSVWPLGN